MNKTFTYSLAATAIFTSLNAFASGLFLQEAVVANAGTTGAGDGVYTRSAAAMWTNPATMSHMGESKTTINTMAFDLEMKYQDNLDSSDNGKAHSVMPSFGAFHAHQVTDKLHLGIALGAVGGSSLDYGSEWAGSPLLEDITLTAMQVNPSLSYKLNDQWSVGAGIQLSWAALQQTTSALTIKQDTDWAYGYNLGVMYTPTDKLKLGASYRSKLEHEFNNEVKGLGNVANSLSTDIALPEIIDFSASYALNSQLDLLASVQFHRWSAWDETVLDFGATDLGGVPIERDWDDVWKFAVGADYQLNSDWRLKAGFSYETSPQDDPSMQWVDLPVGEQYRYSVGASTYWDDILIDVFYEYADLGSVDMNRNLAGSQVNLLNGSFDGRIHFVGVSATF
ncbi:OmpP1/FadL family transporter [Vibrio crassostreae]|uniref:Long-chain fatty acid transport protein n=2 Tax=Vibrio crassostreae TaxID=246167 RepID=A0ABM9QV58_9VIBR|nr:outer membrane protein transport protein [Vibrio crassostreae]TCL28840.1 long-subunit fatty acid transport protein [Vibrio crassostreae]TCT42677.1 long-subunit fatty acid transport protein [Vibrio crassostreae]TCT51608.1 long-subunit fatty acid transport protein [Vibrio crassostreae]TCT60941.1 long-subunit fatty acid transport protein [Vibrio crassostreae]TCV59385.1 long-subunit fatty acid transport protein [Vibrio crassostreae]